MGWPHARTEPGSVVAALGPTNTGKTHRAVERMLEHGSGMIGLPLRLLAREVYDRLTARLGEGAVSLVTGEERRISPRAHYWVCTVEAMPLQRRVEFLAVDEIQLAGEPQRGHVFTDRLLHARGTHETWFMGSDTVAPLLRHFVPEASFERLERLSTLRHAGRASLRGLPSRSAVVAFSMAEVYEIAERLRQLRGGVAVVLGALSPRTRNAQVAMYQAGEVQHLVATDAIGMGLNLDLDHVALAGLHKFDGRRRRPLHAAEVGQIAGRAGRHLRDGSFGALKPLGPLPEELARRIEEHRYPALERLYYRNPDLDFTSLRGLQESLAAPAPDPRLTRIGYADDTAALHQLAANPEVQALAQDAEGVSLLWEVCQVPNFQKQLDMHHAAALRPFFEQLRRHGQLDRQHFERSIARLDRVEGDLDALTDRLARIRTYSYLSQRGGWLAEAAELQQRTAAIEERLGDALHARLVERFVSAGRKPGRRRRAQEVERAPAVASDSPFAALATLAGSLPGATDDEGETIEAFAARIESANHGDFHFDARGRVSFAGEQIARLTAGRSPRTPEVALADADGWPAGSRARVLRRLQALTRDVVAGATGGPFQLQVSFEAPAARGLAYVLEESLGLVPRKEAEPLWKEVAPSDRAQFEHLGFRFERRLALLEGAADETALAHRRMLRGLHERPVLPRPMGAPVLRELDPRFALAWGYVEVGARLAIRLDHWRSLAHAADSRANQGLAAALAPLELSPGEQERVARSLGFEVHADEAGTPQWKSAPRRSKRRRRRGARGKRERSDEPSH